MRLRTKIAVMFSLLLAAALAVCVASVLSVHRSIAQNQSRVQLARVTVLLADRIRAEQRALVREAAITAASLRDHPVADADDALRVSLDAAARDSGATFAMRLRNIHGGGHRELLAVGAQASTARGLLTDRAVNAALRLERPALLLFGTDGKAAQVAAAPLRDGALLLGSVIDSAMLSKWSELAGASVALSPIGTGTEWQVSSEPSKETAAGSAQRAILSGSEPRMELVVTRRHTDVRAIILRESLAISVAAIVCFLVCALAGLALANYLTSPLQDLTAAVDRMRTGRYSAPLELDRADELGALAKGLHVMHHAVRTRDQEIYQLAYEDFLTRLMNRTAFVQALDRALSTRRSGAVVVAIIDIERFRRINECLGYAVGDEVLKNIAARLTAEPHDADGVARLAADQFAAFARLAPGTTVQKWGASLLARFENAILVQEQPIDLSGTAGLAIAPIHASAAPALMRCAELALARARDAKRPLMIYEAAFKPIARDQLSLLGELQRAIDDDQLELHFQPKINLATTQVAGAEVLLRWRHPVRGLLSPIDFIPFAEQTGFIRRMTRWVLDKAAAQAAAWYRAGKPLPIAVNISAEDIADPLLDQRVAAALSLHELPPSMLTLEVTESGFIEDPTRALRMLESLAALGVHLSIDDFGTGYSSLSYLARMPVDEVKIDHSFVQGLEKDQDVAAIVRAAIDMGHSLGLQVVAEGIESENSASRLQGLGCDLAQGFLFALPMPAREIEAWLEGRKRETVLAGTTTLLSFDADEDLLDATNMFRIPQARR